MNEDPNLSKLHTCNHKERNGKQYQGFPDMKLYKSVKKSMTMSINAIWSIQQIWMSKYTIDPC